MKEIRIRPLDSDVISYCGVFCGGCSSYHIGTCHGCRSEVNEQKRISKWKCRKRLCCLEKKYYSCGDCTDLLGCKIRKSLIKSYKINYNLDLDQNAKNVSLYEHEDWLKTQVNKYLCNQCGGVISPYDLKCIQCGNTKS